MATYYGDGIATSDSAFVLGYTRNVATQGSRLRVFSSRITRLLTTASSDLARMIVLPASARVWQLWFATNGAATAGAMNIGLYYAGSAADGAVINASYFGTAIVVTASAHTEVFNESTTPTEVKRGNTLWELAGLSAEPSLPTTNRMHITITPSTTFTVTAPIVQLYALVTLGD